jgi:hypothetical protein
MRKVLRQIFGTKELDKLKKTLVHLTGNFKSWIPMPTQRRQWLKFIREFEALDQITYVIEPPLYEQTDTEKFVGFEESPPDREKPLGFEYPLVKVLVY